VRGRRRASRPITRRRVSRKKVSRVTSRVGRGLKKGYPFLPYHYTTRHPDRAEQQDWVGNQYGPIRDGQSRGYMTGNGQKLTKAGGAFTLTNFKKKKVDALSTKTLVCKLQGVTNFDVNVGWFGLYHRVGTVTTSLPCHVYNLTTMFMNSSDAGEGTIEGAACIKLGWSGLTNTADVSREQLQFTGANTPTGVVNPLQTIWGVEYNSTHNYNEVTSSTLEDVPSKFFLKSLHARLNLYGARKRDTHFDISLVQTLNAKTDFFSASAGDPEFKTMVQGITKPYLYSNLITDRKGVDDWRKYLKVIKNWRYTVEASETTDGGLGNMKEVNLHININRLYNLLYDNNGNGILGHKVENQDDWIERDENVTTSTQHINYMPTENSRIYFMIRAFSPEASDTDVTDITGNRDPSYDIVLKRTIFTADRF